VKIVWDSKKDPNFARSAHLIVTEKFEKANPEIVQRFVNAVVKAARWASEESHRDAVMEALAKTGRPIQGYIDDYSNQEMRYRMSPLLDDWLRERYRDSAKEALSLGLIRKAVNIDEGYELKYVDKAAKDLGLENYWTRYAPDGKPLAN
jgi:sulfonate transport system substrate-binding protein